MSMNLGTFTLDTKLNVEGIQNGVSRIQSLFDKIDLPFEQKGALTKNFQDLTRELSKYQTQIAKGFTSKGDLKNLESSGRKINALFESLEKKVSKINLQQIHFDVENPQELKDALQVVNELEKKRRIEFQEAGLDKIQSGLNKISSSIGGDTKKKVQEAFDVGNIDAFNAGMLKMADLIHKTVDESAQLKSYAEQVKNAFKSGDTAALEKIVTEIQSLNTEVEGESTQKLKNYSKGLLEIAQNSKNIGKIDGLRETTSQLEEARAKASSLSEAYQNELRAAAGNARTAIHTLASKIVEIRNEEERTAESSHAMAQSFDQIKTRLAYFFSAHSAIMLMRRAFQYTLNTVKELDAAMTQTAVVTNFSVGDMWSALPKYKDTANELGVSLKGVYETMTLFYQQGLQTDQVFQIGTETLKMARIAGMDYETATKAMTAALRGFNLELNELSAQRVNDVYSKLAAITASDTGEIATAMEKTASIANNAGMELETTAAFLSQIIETTQEAPETAGTAMKTIIARFTEMKKAAQDVINVDGEEISVNKVDAALKSVGVSLKDVNGQFRDLDDVFLELSSKWDSLDKMSQRYVATMAAGSRQQSRFIAMMSNYGRTMELVNEAQNAEGASDTQFNKTMDSMDAKLNQLQTAWQSFLMGISNSTAIKGIVDVLTKMVNLFTKATTGASGFITAVSRISAVVTIFKVLSASVKSLTTNISQATLSWSTFRQGFSQNFNNSIFKQWQEEKQKKQQTEQEKVKAAEEAIVKELNLEKEANVEKKNIYNQDVANFEEAQEQKVAAAKKAVGEITGVAQQGVVGTGAIGVAGAGEVVAESSSEQQNAAQGMVIQPKAVKEIDLSDAEVKAFYDNSRNAGFVGTKTDFNNHKGVIYSPWYGKTEYSDNQKNQVNAAKEFAKENIKQQRKLGIGAQNFQQLGLESGADVANPHKLRAQYAKDLPQYGQKDYESLVNQEFNGHLLDNEGKQIRARQMIADMNAVDVAEGRETFGSRMQAKRDALIAFNQSQSESSEQPEPEPEVLPQNKPTSTDNSGNEEKTRKSFRETKGGQWIEKHAYAAGMAANLLGNAISMAGDKMAETREKTDGLVIGLQSAGSGLSMMGSTTGMLVSLMGPWGVAVAAVIGVITAVISAHSQYKKALEEEKNAAVEAAKAANEKAEKNREEFKTLEETVDDYQNGKASRSEVADAAAPLIESYNLQNEEASLLCGTYDQLIERMRQLRLEEEQETYKKNKEAQDKIDTAFNANVMDDNMANVSPETERWFNKAKFFDPGVSSKYEINEEDLKDFQLSGTGYNIGFEKDLYGRSQLVFEITDPSGELTSEQKRAAIKDLQRVQGIVTAKFGDKAKKNKIYTGIEKFVGSFTEAVDQYEETASGAASSINTQAALLGKTEGINLDKIQSVDDYNKAVEAYTERLKTLTDKKGNYFRDELIIQAVQQFFAQNGTTNTIQIAEKKLGESKPGKAGLTLDQLIEDGYGDIRYLQIITSINPEDYHSKEELYAILDNKEMEAKLNIVSTFQKNSDTLLDKIAAGEELDETDFAGVTALLNQIDNQNLKNKWAEAQNKGYLAMLDTLREIYAETKKVQEQSLNEIVQKGNKSQYFEELKNIEDEAERQKILIKELNNLNELTDSSGKKIDSPVKELTAITLGIGKGYTYRREEDNTADGTAGHFLPYTDYKIAVNPVINENGKEKVLTEEEVAEYIQQVIANAEDKIANDPTVASFEEAIIQADKEDKGIILNNGTTLTTWEEITEKYKEAAQFYNNAKGNVTAATEAIEKQFEEEKITREDANKLINEVKIIANIDEYSKAIDAIKAEKLEKQIKITSAEDLETQAKLLKGYKEIEKKVKSIKQNGYKISGEDFSAMLEANPDVMSAVKNVDVNTGQVTFDAQKLNSLFKDMNSTIKEMSNGLATSLNQYIQQLNNAKTQWNAVKEASTPNENSAINEENLSKALDGIDQTTAALLVMKAEADDSFGEISSSADDAGTSVTDNCADMVTGLNAAQQAAVNLSKALAACASDGKEIGTYQPVNYGGGSSSHSGSSNYNSDYLTDEEKRRRAINNGEEKAYESAKRKDAVDTANEAGKAYLRAKAYGTKDEISNAKTAYMSALKETSDYGIKFGEDGLVDYTKYITKEQRKLGSVITTLGNKDDGSGGKGGSGGGGGGGSDSKEEDSRSKEDIEKENAQARLNTLKSEEADIDRELNLLQKLPIRLYPLELAMQGRKLANLKKQITAQKEVVKQSEAELANLRKKNSQLDKYYTIEETKDDFGNTQRTFQYSDQYINASEEERKKADEGGLNDIKSAVDTTNTENDALSGLMGDFGGQALDMLNSGIDMAKQAIEKMVEVFSALVDWWTNREDWLYNLLSKIEQETRNFARLQQVEERFRLGSTEGVDELVAAWYAQKESLDKQIVLEEELIASRKAELQFLNLQNALFSPAFHYDYKEERVIENPWVYDIYKLVFKMGSLIPEIGGVFSSLESWMENNKERMEKAVQEIEDAKDKILEIEKQQLELRQQYMDDEVSLEELVMGKIIEKMQEEIDSMTALSEAISEANSKLLETLQNNLEKMRQDRENANTEEELAKKERRLAYLRQDTSGANQVEIRKLEEELDKGHQDYTDKLIDQKITELQKQNDKAAAQREAQINLAQAQLDYTKRYGLQWEEARELIKNGYDDQGRLRVGSELFDLLMSSEDFAGLGAGSTRQLSQRMEWDITGIAGATFRAINDVWNKGFLLNNPQTNNVHPEEEPKKYNHLPQYLNFLQPAYEALQDYFVNWTGKNIEAFFHQLGDEETSPLAGRKIIGWLKRTLADASRDTSNQSNRGNINYATTTTPDLFKANNFGNKTTQNTISNKTYQNNIVNYNNFNTNVGNNWDRAGIVTVMRDVLGEWADGFMSLLNPFDNSRSH